MIFNLVTEYIILESVFAEGLILFPIVFGNVFGVMDYEVCEFHPFLVQMPFHSPEVFHYHLHSYLLIID